jgi:hypothetical protein
MAIDVERKLFEELKCCKILNEKVPQALYIHGDVLKYKATRIHYLYKLKAFVAVQVSDIDNLKKGSLQA